MRLHPRAVHLLPLLLPILLLPMGEAFGQPECTPSPQPIGDFQGPGTRIHEMAAVGSTLFLSVQDGANVYGLWKLEEGQSSPELMEPPGGSWSSRVLNLFNLTVVGQRLFFVTHVELNNNNNLWATDAAHTGISQVAGGVFPGNSVRDQGELTVLGSSLYIRGNNGLDELRLWWSDGTNVQVVKDGLGNDVLDPSKPVAMGGKLFFAATDSQAGKELWVIENAGGPAKRLKDLWPGTLSSNPASLTVMGGKLYFTATTPGQDASLWVSDGTEDGTDVVAGPETLGSPHGTPSELTAAGDKLFFHMTRAATGDELWVSDGTAANTRILEIQTDGSGGDPEQLTAVGSMLFFIANDASSGREPWRSDGTPAGTVMVHEFVDGSSNSFERPELKAGPGVLLLSIYADDWGKELWSASGAGVVRLTDIVAGTESSTPHALTIVGNRLYFAAGPTFPQDDGLYWLPLNQVDCHAPSVTCPGPLHIEAVSPEGAYVFLPPPVQMSDDSFTPLTVSYSPAAFAIFGVDNSTPATITVRDLAGNEGTCPITINVQDTRGPELVCPASLVVEATGPDGANVSYPVEAWDAVSGVSSVSANPPSGSHFRLGQEARVMVTAEDGRGLASTCEFPVSVKDTQPPKLVCPRDIVQVATSAGPIPVTYAPLQLEDATGVTRLESSHPSGSLFEQDRTDVTLTASDSQGNSSECTFSVYIVDPVTPTITCPGPQQAVATGPEGAVVEFPEASAEDALGPPALRYSAESGSTFPVGETTVTATATDSKGNEASCSFTVTVTDPGQEVPPTGCACRSGSASASVYWLLLALAPLWARRRIGRLAR